jgi:hypothetical protein
MSPDGSAIQPWPALPYEEWADTIATLHRWTQVVGKVRMVRSPWVNHSWHVTLYASPRGLTTGTIPAAGEGFQIDLDFLSHQLRVESPRGRAGFDLVPMSVAEFYRQTAQLLAEMGLETEIDLVPNEVEDAVPFDEDTDHASYDAEAVTRFFRALAHVDRVFKRFRGRFAGKCSPVHFFWGSFDHAVTRFSGRSAPPHPGGFPNLPDWITREAYSHEVSSAGFWPGGESHPAPIFYSYAYPSPEGFSECPVRPEEARWVTELGEWVLPYEAVRTAANPDETLLAFLEDTYAGAAEKGGWDREALDWNGEEVPVERRDPLA